MARKVLSGDCVKDMFAHAVCLQTVARWQQHEAFAECKHFAKDGFHVFEKHRAMLFLYFAYQYRFVFIERKHGVVTFRQLPEVDVFTLYVCLQLFELLCQWFLI